MRRSLVLSLSFLLLAGVTACGADEEAAAPEAGAGERIEVVLRDFELDPSTVTLAGPGSYTFVAVNEGEVDHALEIEGHGVESETDTIAPGEQAELTVELSEEGEYELYCPIGNHRELGMDGAVVLGSAGGEDEETTTEDDDGSDYRY